MTKVAADAPAPAQKGVTCSACGAHFASRNVLFKHLRQTADCADASNMTAEQRLGSPCDAAPPRPAAPRGPQLKKKGEPKPPPKRLHLETRAGSYEAELHKKVGSMEELFKGLGHANLPQIEVFASPPEHFRMRAEFDIWHSDAGLRYIMFDGKERIPVDHYPMGARRICDELMPTLLRVLEREESLRVRLFQANFHTTLFGDAMVSLLYHTPFQRNARRGRGQPGAAEEAEEAEEADGAQARRVQPGPLTAEWEAAAGRLQEALRGASVVGRSRGEKRVVGRDWVQEQLQVAGAPAPLTYRQPEGAFSQPNGDVAQHMVGWARAVARDDHAAVGSSGPHRPDDLLELYCGNGNFAIALAPCFRRAVGTELVKSSLEAAKMNADDNGVKNIAFARVSSEEFAQAWDGQREFQRLAGIDLGQYEFNTVLVDPPRAGLGSEVATFLARFQRIVYVSCNPETLCDDLATLCETHTIRRIAAFDQFPYTDHMEAGVLLVRSDA